MRDFPQSPHDWVTNTKDLPSTRIIMCLLLADAWFSEFFSTGPILCTESIQLFLPCDIRLFQAPTASKWAELKMNGRNASGSRLTISSADYQLPILCNPGDQYSMKVILCTILLRIYDSYHVLFCSVEAGILARSEYVPWRVLARTEKAKINVGLVLQAMELYKNLLEDIPSDCLILWHHMGIMLTTDCYLLEEAAGKAGTEAAVKAIARVKIWARTPASRRACLHASQAFRATSLRRPLDGGSFQSPYHLFNAALVLGLYLFVAPAEVSGKHSRDQEFELLSDVDWREIGAEGLVEREAQSTTRTDNAGVNFIRFGGPITIDGESCHGDVRSCQRVLLDFASLLDGMKKWRIGDYSRLLYTISENIGHLHAAVDSTP